MASNVSLVLRSSALTAVLTGLVFVAAACGSDDKTDTGSSSGSSGSSGTGTSGGGGTVVFEDSGAPPANSGVCASVSSCEGALCKCTEGPNKDKSCQKTDRALSTYCDKLCEVCK